jgi:Ca2+-binding EF-hand superfamily protein
MSILSKYGFWEILAALLNKSKLDHFQTFSQDRSGSVSVGEFLSVPELKENPLVKRVVDVFDDDLSGEVDFKGKPTVAVS